MYRVKGKIKGKTYLSRKKFKLVHTATSFGYSKVYNKSGMTKKKNQLTNMQILKA